MSGSRYYWVIAHDADCRNVVLVEGAEEAAKRASLESGKGRNVTVRHEAGYGLSGDELAELARKGK